MGGRIAVEESAWVEVVRVGPSDVLLYVHGYGNGFGGWEGIYVQLSLSPKFAAVNA